MLSILFTYQLRSHKIAPSSGCWRTLRGVLGGAHSHPRKEPEECTETQKWEPYIFYTLAHPIRGYNASHEEVVRHLQVMQFLAATDEVIINYCLYELETKLRVASNTAMSWSEKFRRGSSSIFKFQTFTNWRNVEGIKFTLWNLPRLRNERTNIVVLETDLGNLVLVSWSHDWWSKYNSLPILGKLAAKPSIHFSFHQRSSYISCGIFAI